MIKKIASVVIATLCLGVFAQSALAQSTVTKTCPKGERSVCLKKSEGILSILKEGELCPSGAEPTCVLTRCNIGQKPVCTEPEAIGGHIVYSILAPGDHCPPKTTMSCEDRCDKGEHVACLNLDGTFAQPLRTDKYCKGDTHPGCTPITVPAKSTSATEF